MAVEIERKFLVKSDAWRTLAEGKLYCQGYMLTAPGKTVRVRIVGDQGYLTIKGPSNGTTRAEFEYLIPVEDATEMLTTLCEKPLIEKKRYKIFIDDLTWEVDEFLGENQGLILAEVELEEEDQVIKLPEWIGQEVSNDSRYYNSSLVKNPYCQWSDSMS